MESAITELNITESGFYVVFDSVTQLSNISHSIFTSRDLGSCQVYALLKRKKSIQEPAAAMHLKFIMCPLVTVKFTNKQLKLH